jgi:transcriptional repressor NrdR
MKCPRCSSLDNKVIDSRINQYGDITRRRRECIACQGRYTTYERVEALMPMVIKKDGRREAFDREKIFGGIQKACQKRSITTSQIEKTVSDIEKRASAFSVKELPSRTLGQLVMTALHGLDMVAYIRFASVYREFKDVEEFVTDLKLNPPAAPSADELAFDFADPVEDK